MSRRFLGWAVSALALGCAGHTAPDSHTAPTPPRSSGPTVNAPPPPESPFHVVAAAFFGNGDGLHLEQFVLGERLFIHRTALEFRDGAFAEQQLKMPEASVAGDVDRELWSVRWNPLGGTLIHWKPGYHDWQPVGFELREDPIDWPFRSVRLHQWGPQKIVVIDQVTLGTRRRELWVWEGGPRPHALRLQAKAGMALDQVLTLESGELLIAGEVDKDKQAHLARWKPGAREPKVTLLGSGHCLPNALVSEGGSRLMVVGSTTHDVACALRFDGASWSPVDLPDGHSSASSYARAHDGSEWITLRRGRADRLWTRSHDEAWRQIPFPPQLEDPPPAGLFVLTASVFVRPGGNVWLSLYARGCSGYHELLLTSETPSRGICLLFGADPTCSPLYDYPKHWHAWVGSADCYD